MTRNQLVEKIESQEESSSSSMPEEDPIVLQAQASGLVKEEIEGLTSDQLKVVVSQLERSQEDEVRAYFGTDDPAILKKLFIQNAQKQKSKFEISGKIFKLRQDRIYAQKTEIAKGGYSVIYKIKELSLETFKVFEVARKTMNDKASVHEIENEYEKLKAVAELALQDQKCHLCDAFQAAPYRIVHKLKKDDRTQVAYLEGPLYGGDAFDAIVDIMVKGDQVLKAFDLIIQGIAFLQEKKIIHVDIKLENMFADILENGEIRFRLGDFGGVHYFADLKKGNVNLCHTHEFTPADEIPSVNASLEALNQLSTFQLGNALFIAFKEGYLPGYEDGQYLKLEKVTSENVRDMLAGCKEIPEAAIDFIVALVNPKRVDRPTRNDLLLAWEKAKTAMPELFG